MLALEFTLYRFVCDITTFTGLFAEDEEGRSIPDTASFTCCWSRVPRAKHSTLNPSHMKSQGNTANTFFKSLGTDMALTFSGAHTAVRLNGDAEVITFQVKPSEYTGGDIPVIAKGTLDPLPYFGKPKKNYAIKLRDALGQVIGKLLFALEVTEIDDDEGEPSPAPQTTSQEETAVYSDTAGVKPPPPAATTTVVNTIAPSRAAPPPAPVHAVAHSAQTKPAPRAEAEAGSGGRSRADSHVSTHSSSANTSGIIILGESSKAAMLLVPAPTLAPPMQVQVRSSPPPRREEPHRQLSPPRPSTTAAADAHAASPLPIPPPSSSTSSPGVREEVIDVKIERAAVKPSAINLDHPAPLLLGGEYHVKVRFGGYAFYTTAATCQNPKEVAFGAQQATVPITAAGGSRNGASGEERLRFSLWENNKQVAGFSLDPAKFRVAPGVWKEYAIPFRYYPTQQASTLDVTVRRREAPARGAATPPPKREPSAEKQPSGSRAELVKYLPPVSNLSPLVSAKHPVPVSSTQVVTRRSRSGSSPRPKHSSGERHADPTKPYGAFKPTAPAKSLMAELTGPSSATSSPATSAGFTTPPAKQPPPSASAGGAAAARAPRQQPPSSPPRSTPPPMQTISAANRPAAPPSPLRAREGAATSPAAGKRETSSSSPPQLYQQRDPTPGLEVPSLVDHRIESTAHALGVPDTPFATDGLAEPRATPYRSAPHRESPHRGDGGGNSSTMHSSTPLRRPASGAAAGASTSLNDSAAGPSSRPSAATRTEPDDHEQYLARVMARLEQQQLAAPRQRTSLMEEWMNWRDERRSSSRANSMNSDRRSPSARSVQSRDDSVASVVSRRAITPLPTKSFVNSAMQSPYQPEYSTRRRSSVDRNSGRPPLLPQ